MNSTFASFVQQMFGVRPMQGTSKQTSNSFMSVQAKPEGAPDNQVALSEAEKEKKKKDKKVFNVFVVENKYFPMIFIHFCCF